MQAKGIAALPAPAAGFPKKRKRSAVQPDKLVLPKLVLSVLGAVIGGYGLSATLVALLAALLVRSGLARSKAVVSASMAGFLMCLALLVWAFSNVKLRILWAA